MTFSINFGIFFIHFYISPLFSLSFPVQWIQYYFVFLCLLFSILSINLSHFVTILLLPQHNVQFLSIYFCWSIVILLPSIPIFSLALSLFLCGKLFIKYLYIELSILPLQKKYIDYLFRHWNTPHSRYCWEWDKKLQLPVFWSLTSGIWTGRTWPTTFSILSHTHRSLYLFLLHHITKHIHIRHNNTGTNSHFLFLSPISISLPSRTFCRLKSALVIFLTVLSSQSLSLPPLFLFIMTLFMLFAYFCWSIINSKKISKFWLESSS